MLDEAATLVNCNNWCCATGKEEGGELLSHVILGPTKKYIEVMFIGKSVSGSVVH